MTTAPRAISRLGSVLAAALLLALPAHAQPAPPDPAFLQQALGAMQAQRNQALDQAAVETARAAMTAAELEKAKARIKELEAPKPAEPPK